MARFTKNYHRRYTDASKIEYVAPLTNKRDIERVQKAIMMQGRFNRFQTEPSKINKRNLMLFDFGIYTGLRVSDIIKLKVSDVAHGLKIREKKTGKINHTSINAVLKKELDNYIVNSGLTNDDWLFPSTRAGGACHVSRGQVYRMIHQAGLACNLPHLGSHTMRKTFGRMWYEQGKSLATLQKIFNHASQLETMHYIGIQQEDIDKQIDEFDPLA